jgi:urease accessory protein
MKTFGTPTPIIDCRFLKGRKMKNTFLRALTILPTFVMSGIAYAHPGHGGGLMAGLAHPLLGLDHLLAMFAVGLWAARLGKEAAFAVPAGFVALLAGAAALAMSGIVLPYAESGIAVSLLVLGLLVAFMVKLQPVFAVVLVALFALFHGTAHGLELPATASPMQYALGFLTATVILHALGVMLGRAWMRNPVLLRATGAAIASGGVLMLALR